MPSEIVRRSYSTHPELDRRFDGLVSTFNRTREHRDRLEPSLMFAALVLYAEVHPQEFATMATTFTASPYCRKTNEFQVVRRGLSIRREVDGALERLRKLGKKESLLDYSDVYGALLLWSNGQPIRMNNALAVYESFLSRLGRPKKLVLQ